jgi:hypothetical protein
MMGKLTGTLWTAAAVLLTGVALAQQGARRPS